MMVCAGNCSWRSSPVTRVPWTLGRYSESSAAEPLSRVGVVLFGLLTPAQQSSPPRQQTLGLFLLPDRSTQLLSCSRLLLQNTLRWFDFYHSSISHLSFQLPSEYFPPLSNMREIVSPVVDSWTRLGHCFPNP
jgi:hypothetical protein